MKIPLISAVTLLTIFTLISAQEWYERNNPHFINEQDYQRLVINPETRNNGVTFLKFFTPWCRYCKYLKDIIDDLRAKQRWEITIYEVNCDGSNHHFCSRMGVHSFPKMIVFENGNAQESMDGFYPYQVVRELFIKYNRTVQRKVEQAVFHEKVEAHDAQKAEVKQENNQQANYIQPQVVVPVEKHKNDEKHEENKHIDKEKSEKKRQHKQEGKKHKSEKKKETHKDHAKAEHQRVEKHKSDDSASKESKHEQSPHKEPVKEEKPKPVQPVKTEEKHPQSNQQRHQPHSPNIPPKKEENHPASSPSPSQPQSHQPQAPTQTTIKKPQQMIEEEQNIAIVDQDMKQTQKQKKLVEQISTSKTDTIDLTKILPVEDHVQYGKYIIYCICLIVGGYYFAHIMKAHPSAEQAKPHLFKSGQSKKSSQPKIPTNISFEDSELREELHFEHPNQEEINLNSVQIRDEDL